MKKKRKMTDEEKAQMEYLNSFLNKSKGKTDEPKKDFTKENLFKKEIFWSKGLKERFGL